MKNIIRFNLYVCLYMALGFIPLNIKAQVRPQGSYNSADIKLMLQKLNTAGTVLYVAAHPDDENTRLLSYLANERCVRTAYISLTRGDGGQNLIGNDIGPYLGLIRSFELMAARNVDKAEQFFTRAYDFGYSKNPEETFNIWDRDKVLDDLVFIIRYYKPDLIITRFATDGSGGHGHHTASAILAEEAFVAAADPTAYTHQLEEVSTWQAHALLYNNAARFWNPNADVSGNIEINVGKYNPLIGRSYGEIAGLSRSMHKSQGFGSRNWKGDILEYFKPILGYKPENDIFDGVDISLNRLKGAEAFTEAVSKSLAVFDMTKPEAIIPFLLDAKEAVALIEDEYWRKFKYRQLEELILACTGLWIESTSNVPYIAAGDSIEINHYAINRSDAKIQLQQISISDKNIDIQPNTDLANNIVWEQKVKVKIPEDQRFTGPYWLRANPENGIFQLEDQRLLTRPVDDGHIDCHFTFNIDGRSFIVRRPILYRWVDPVQGEQFRLLEITPDVMINFTESVIVFGDELPKVCKINVKAGKDGISGQLRLDASEDFRIEPPFIDFSLAKKDEEKVFEFILYPGKFQGLSNLRAVAKVNDTEWNRSLVKLSYDHIPIQMVFPEAGINVSTPNLQTNGGRVAYVNGAGDDVATGIRQMGYIVDEIAADALEKTDLKSYKALVLGVRAFNTHERLYAQMNKLNDYIASGGVLIVQYNTNSWAGPLKDKIGPYPFEITRKRVTDETAPVHIELVDHRVLNYPNKISEKDFEGWVQERGLYFADKWDDIFEAPLSMSDPGEEAHKGSLIIAPFEKGHFVYTGISFFRQVPHGTPGAFRLLANLIELNNIQP